jgi:lysophospholipid acyltransferase (LPLAT)-like uncharacterized protein
MRILGLLFAKIIGLGSALYINMVFWTSKIEKKDPRGILENLVNEQYVFVFWHGDSYCMYPILKNRPLLIITTADRRGDYISEISKRFGYVPIRIPDKATGGKSLAKIKDNVDNHPESSIGITLDGPLGPYHEPKEFPFIAAVLTGKRVLPITVKVSRKIQLNKRWDKYSIPLPFGEIKLRIHEPLEVAKDDRKNDFSKLREKVLKEMDTEF